MVKAQALRLVAVIEAASVTGPAKNLIAFCAGARQPDRFRPDLPTIEPLLITYVRGARSSSSFVAAAENAGLEVEVVPERFRFDPRVPAELRARIVAFQPDLVQTHNVKSHFLYRAAGLRRRYPWIAFHHGYTATDLKMSAYNQLDRWSLRGVERAVTVCGPFADQLARIGVPRARIRIRHNSVRMPAPPPFETVRRLRQSLGIGDRERVVLAVGRFSREKGHTDLIDAFALLRRSRGQGVRLLLVGDGPERSRIESAVRAGGLAGAVVFTGQVPDVQPFYALAAALAVPSHSEGSPNVVLEAMAAGVPVVATAVGGVPELVNDGETGLLVAARTPSTLAAALDRVLSDEPLARRLAQQANARVGREFTADAYKRDLLEIYHDTVANWRRSTNWTLDQIAYH